MNTKKIEEIIEKSGNNFHYNVVEFLRDAGWYVLVSPYYNDNFTDKSREVDIIAEKSYPVGRFGTVNIRLFIECKYVILDTVFWFDNKNLTSALKRVLSDTPLEDPSKWSMTNDHRYMENVMVAKLFASENNKSPDNDIVYKAITQSLNAMAYYKNDPSFIPVGPHSRIGKIITLNYPVVICNNLGHFWKYDFATKNPPEQITNNFQMEIQYAYLDKNKSNKNEYFLLDFVAFDKLNHFIDDIEKKDLGAVKEKIAFENY